MANTDDRKRKYRKTLLIALGVIAFIFIAITGAELWLKHKIRQVIEQRHPGLTTGAYEVHAGRIGVSIVGRSVKFRDMEFKVSGDTETRKVSQIRSLDISAELLSLSGIKFKKDRSGRYAISVRQITLKSPDITASINSGEPAGVETDTLPKKNIFDIITSLKIGGIDIDDGRTEYILWKSDEKLRYTADNINVELDGIAIDSTAKNGFFSLESIEGTVGRLGHVFQQESVSLDIDGVNINSRKKTLSVDSLKMTPKYPRYEYASKVTGHPDWTEARTGRIFFQGLDLSLVIDNGAIKADSALCENLYIASFKNRQLPQPPRFKDLFYMKLHKSDIKIDIPVINLAGIYAEYEELSENGLSPGIIFFSEMNGRFEGLSNIEAEGREHYTLSAHGKLMGQGDITADFTFPVSPADDRFKVDARVGTMQLAAINRMITPLMEVKVESGELNRLDMTIEGNSLKSSVRMTFLYDNLSVTVMRHKDARLVERGFISDILGTFVINSSNPDKNGTYEATGSFDRDTNRSQFNYLWKSAMQGIQPTVIGRRR